MWRISNFMISTDKDMLDVAMIHNFIFVESYWGQDRSPELMAQAIQNSAYCFGVYYESDAVRKQIGFARVVSDLTTIGYLSDVFIIKEYRGKGLGKWLIQTIVNHPDLKLVKRLILFTQTPDFYSDSMFKIFDQTLQSKFILKKEAAEAAMVGGGIRNNGQQEPMLIHEQKTIEDVVKERKG